jgi:hypothetical protein
LPASNSFEEKNRAEKNSSQSSDRTQKKSEIRGKEKMGFIPWAPIGGSGSRSLSKSGNALEAEAKRYNVSVV